MTVTVGQTVKGERGNTLTLFSGCLRSLTISPLFTTPLSGGRPTTREGEQSTERNICPLTEPLADALGDPIPKEQLRLVV